MSCATATCWCCAIRWPGTRCRRRRCGRVERHRGQQCILRDGDKRLADRSAPVDDCGQRGWHRAKGLRKLRKIEACDHPTEKLEYRLSEDETKCYEFCLKCGKPVTEAEEHKWTVESIEENAEQHRKICKNCKHEVLEDHRFKFIEDTATCEQAGQTVQRCIQCEYEKRTPSQATGHRPSKRADAKSTGKNVRSRVVKRKSKEAAPRTAISGTRDGTTGPAPAAASATAMSAPERRSRTKARLHAAMKNCIAASAALNSARDAQGAFAYPHSYVVSSEECTCSHEVRVCSVCRARDVTEQIEPLPTVIRITMKTENVSTAMRTRKGRQTQVRPRNPNLNQLPAQIRNRTSAKRRNIRRNEYA